MDVFSGFHYHKVDAKGKVSLPKAYRDALEDQVALGMGSAIYKDTHSKFVFVKIMPVAQWNKVKANRDKLTANQKRQMLGVQIVEIDKVGRILVPHSMRKLARTEEGMDVCIVGNDDVIEIWNRDKYEEATIAALYDEETQNENQAFERDIREPDPAGDSRTGEAS